jgi:hypothetical protein
VEHGLRSSSGLGSGRRGAVVAVQLVVQVVDALLEQRLLLLVLAVHVQDEGIVQPHPSQFG